MDKFSAWDNLSRYAQFVPKILNELSTTVSFLTRNSESTDFYPSMSHFPLFTITVEPAGLQVTQKSGLSILQSALSDKVRLPSSCRNGTCRACMCRLKTGQVNYQIEWPGLTREEKTDGWILPCVAEAISDLVLEVPDAVDLK